MNKSKWTLFNDMHSGGGTKEEPYELIFIEAPEEEAKLIFYNKFGHNPERVTCTCCGDDYSISEENSLEQITAYHRDCRYAYFNKKGQEIPEDKAWKCGIGLINDCIGKYVEEAENKSYKHYQTFKTFEKREDVLIIRKKDIKPKDKKGNVPQQGYIWKD